MIGNSSELVDGLKMRFQFTGGGTGDTDDRINLQPASPIYDSANVAAEYGYASYASDNADNSGLQGGSGHIRVTVSP